MSNLRSLINLSTKSHLKRFSVPALALGTGLTLNGVLRIFGRARVPVYCVCPDYDPVVHSRWYRKPPSRLEVEPTPFELETFLRRLSLHRAVLMPCSDDWLRATAALPPTLARRFPASIPIDAVVEAMVNKWEFAELLVRTGTPHPSTRLLQSYEDLHALEASFGPHILKPESSVEFAAKHGVKGYIVRSRDEALLHAQKLEFPIMLQEYIPGPPNKSYFLDGFIDRCGRVCARFARRRIRMYPPELGNSSLTISIPLDEIRDAVSSLDRLLAFVSYRGIFSAEFKYDDRDGQFKLLEVNARPWWFIEFAERCGVDVCTMAYYDALGLPVKMVHSYQTGRRCTFLPHDIRAYHSLHREQALHWWNWLRSWVGANDALFAWDDIGPALAFARSVGKNTLQKSSRRVVTKAA